MGDLDNDQMNPNILHDFADNTVVLAGAENGTNHGNNMRVHLMNNREWTNEQRNRSVQIDCEERKKGKHFMARFKAKWEAEYPGITRRAQNLIDSAKRFCKERWRGPVVTEDATQADQTGEVERKHLDWTTEMKISLVTIDDEERRKGGGFMKRVKERLDGKYPEYRQTSWQKLRDNAARFKKETEIMNLILVRQREEIEPEAMVRVGHIEQEMTANEANTEVDNNEVTEENVYEEEVLDAKDQELEKAFITHLENLCHCSMLELVPREKLPKVRPIDELQKSANKILKIYLKSANTLQEVTDIVYAMGKSIGSHLGVKQRDNDSTCKRTADGGNRREGKLRKEMKELRQNIARASNEIHQRKQRRKATLKEKKILKELKEKMGKEATTCKLRIVKEQWVDKLRYKKIKLEKYMEKRKRKLDNIMFQKDREPFSENWKKIAIGKGKFQKWISLLNSGEKRQYTAHVVDGRS